MAGVIGNKSSQHNLASAAEVIDGNQPQAVASNIITAKSYDINDNLMDLIELLQEIDATQLMLERNKSSMSDNNKGRILF